MDEKNIYRIKFRRGEIEIEVQGDKDYVESKFKELLDLQNLSRTAQPLSKKEEQDTKSTNVKDISLREFIDQFNTNAHMDYIILIGYFLEKYREQDSFTVTDIKKAYREIRETISNAGPFITQNIKKGNIMEAPKKEGVKIATYSLTRKGIQFIENGLTLPQ